MPANNIQQSASLILNLPNGVVATAGSNLPIGALGYSLPLGIPRRNSSAVRIDSDTLTPSSTPALNQAPLTLRRENGQTYNFPLDPIIAVSGKNIVTRRYIAKGAMRGTVKEFFSLDDYEITITGLLMADSAHDLNTILRDLSDLCQANESLLVENDWLVQSFGITRLVIESYAFPNTKGLTNQAYSLKCFSDDSVTLLEEV